MQILFDQFENLDRIYSRLQNEIEFLRKAKKLPATRTILIILLRRSQEESATRQKYLLLPQIFFYALSALQKTGQPIVKETEEVVD